MEKMNAKKLKKRRLRGKGEGTIIKRKDGRWAAVVWLGYQNGKPKRKTYYGRTREQVVTQLGDALQKHRQGSPIVTERQTVGQFLDWWLAESVKPAVRPKTFISYEEQVNLHIKPALGSIQLQKLTAQRLQAYLNEQASGKLSARSVRYQRTVLGIALKKAQRLGLVARNVASDVSVPRGERPDIHPLNPDEARKFLGKVKGNRLEALFTVALAMGLRQGEALGLKWEDIDWESRTMHVRRTLQRVGKEFQLADVKTKSSRRVLELPDEIAAALKAHRSRQLKDKLQAGENWQEWGLVFTTSSGRPVHPRNVVRSFHAILKKAKLERRRFHDLRHSAASLLLVQGVPLKVVSDMLGHSQIAITADIYSHVIPQVRREAMDKIVSLLFADAK